MKQIRTVHLHRNSHDHIFSLRSCLSMKQLLLKINGKVTWFGGWQRSIVPISETVIETLSRLIPGLLVKTAFGGLVIVVFSRLLEQASDRLNKKLV